MTAVLDLRPEHAAIVRDILRQHLPADVRVLVFGSRAHGGARQYSDLDLALASDRPLGLDVTGRDECDRRGAVGVGSAVPRRPG